MKTWLLLVYRIPREPTAGRVYVWRKLKQLGAIAVQDAVWVLPKTRRTEEQLQWLAAEISELGGEAGLWEAAQVYASNPGSLRQQFLDAVNAEYQNVLAGLKRKDADLAALSRQFQQARSRDYFASQLGEQVRERLLAAQGGDA